MYTYILQCWNPYRGKYEKFGTYSTIERAEIMFNKSYFKTRTRRLIRIQEEVLYKAKANESQQS